MNSHRFKVILTNIHINIAKEITIEIHDAVCIIFVAAGILREFVARITDPKNKIFKDMNAIIFPIILSNIRDFQKEVTHKKNKI